MSFFEYLKELIDPRAVSSLWFWVVLVGMWIRVLTNVMGVPVDVLHRAQQSIAQQDLEADPEDQDPGADVIDLARIYASRVLLVWQEARLLQILLGSFILSSLLILGFAYGVELAQAGFMVLAPLAAVFALRVQTALQMQAENPELARLLDILRTHALRLRVLGWSAITLTVIWAILRDLLIPVWY